MGLWSSSQNSPREKIDELLTLTELELELIQPHMAQKPVLRGEVGCACVAREVSVERGGMGERGCASTCDRGVKTFEHFSERAPALFVLVCVHAVFII